MKTQALAALALSFSLAGEAWGCACCSEPGERRSGPVEIGDGVASQLSEIDVAGTAALYMTACGPECVKGVANPADSYSVNLSRENTNWRLAFEGQGENTKSEGTLSFDLPDTLFVFAVDPTPETGPPSPPLYKEWRISGPVTGTGAFKFGMTGDPVATFILHGTGNSCDQSGDFTHWSLIVAGPAADFTLFGPLKPPS